jgi:AraC-like DNA-binding protein
VHRKFQEETGKSYRERLTEVRLTAALPLLDGKLPLTDVCTAVGYTSTTGFISAFRKRFGQTPGEYRVQTRVTGFQS